ncbi:MAG TPA: hypothetical protein VN688_26890 [Gemmataceae bacterium]|nr:hypothetical protein [Gemmataceae bacterium]
MIRLMLIFVCVVGVVPPVWANLIRKESSASRKGLTVEALGPSILAAPKPAYRITTATEILLNGQPCRYEEVPADAVILRMEITSSTDKEILKLHFRSKIGPVKSIPRQAENRLTPSKRPVP